MWSANRKLPEFSIPSRARSLVRNSAYTGMRWSFPSPSRRRGIDCDTRVRLGRRSGCDCISSSHCLGPVLFFGAMLSDEGDDPPLPAECNAPAVGGLAVVEGYRESPGEMVAVMIE